MGRPERLSAASSMSTVASGDADRSTAKAPATWGAAMEVPLMLENPPPGIEELMAVPGAKRSMKYALLEYAATKSPLVVAPTVTAVEMHPGAPVALTYALFPEEITVAMPAERRLSMMALRASSSQGE